MSDLDSATPEQIERANAAVSVNMLDEGTPRYGSAQGYACALTAIMQTDAAIAMDARKGGDGETRLHPKDDSAGRNGIAQGPSQ